LKLQRLQQGLRSVDEYFKDLESTLTKIDMHENEESKIARFVSGLRREIQDVVELYEYSSLKKLVHLAIKVESQRQSEEECELPCEGDLLVIRCKGKTFFTQGALSITNCVP